MLNQSQYHAGLSLVIEINSDEYNSEIDVFNIDLFCNKTKKRFVLEEEVQNLHGTDGNLQLCVDFVTDTERLVETYNEDGEVNHDPSFNLKEFLESQDSLEYEIGFDAYAADGDSSVTLDKEIFTKIKRAYLVHGTGDLELPLTLVTPTMEEIEQAISHAR
ncbi:hypothetical protein VCHA53O466_320035 [Vibrio chagasii]|nr:hypothetical protein VCHA53O466_320035 [Vibrio chagasii]